MRAFSFRISLCILFALGTKLYAQGPDPDFMNQAKRLARTNDHIEKKLSGQIVRHIYKGLGLGLDAFVFRSDANEHYLVDIKRSDGQKLFPLLKMGQTMSITVTGDPKLLEEIIYYTSELVTIQNKFDVKLKGLANLKALTSNKGSYERDNSLHFDLPAEPEVFHEEVSIVRKKKVRGNRWAYILGNDDTLIVRYKDDDMMKGRNSLSYLKMLGIASKGVYFKAPNTYHVLSAVPFMHDRNQRNMQEILVGKAAIVLDLAEFDVIKNNTDSRGLFNAVEVKRGNDTLKLSFNARNGEDIQKAVSDIPSFKAYYKPITENQLMLYGMKDDTRTTFFNNSTELFQVKNNYAEETIEFSGEITEAEFGRPDNGTDLRNFLISDSVFVKVNQIVALNIQKMIRVGKKIKVEGWLRKAVPGEVNIKGYSILAASAITIDGKRFKQIYYDIKKTL